MYTDRETKGRYYSLHLFLYIAVVCSIAACNKDSASSMSTGQQTTKSQATDEKLVPAAPIVTAPGGTTPASQSSIFTFPKRPNDMGELGIRDSGSKSDVAWQPFALAEGTVLVPRGKEVCLTINTRRRGAELRPLLNIDSSTVARIQLGGTQFGDSEIQYLANLTQVRELDLSGAQITDSGLISIKNYSQLRQLDLSFTDVTDASIPLLRGLPTLQRLILTGTKVSPDGLSILRASCPSTTIVVE